MAEEPEQFFFSLPQWAGLFHLCGLLAFQLSWGGASTASIQMRERNTLEKKGFGEEETLHI